MRESSDVIVDIHLSSENLSEGTNILYIEFYLNVDFHSIYSKGEKNSIKL